MNKTSQGKIILNQNIIRYRIKINFMNEKILTIKIHQLFCFGIKIQVYANELVSKTKTYVYFLEITTKMSFDLLN